MYISSKQTAYIPPLGIGTQSATGTGGITTTYPSRPRAQLNMLASHTCVKPAKEKELAAIKEEIQHKLEESNFLFKYANRPEKLGIETEHYDANFNKDPEGLKKKWQEWEAKVINKAAPIYQSLKDNEAVFMVLWHPNMYGGDVTHVSAIMIGNTDDGLAVDMFHNEHHHPAVDMMHHESVPVKADKAYDDGRLPKALGLRHEDYDTTGLFAKITNKPAKLSELPAAQSIRLGGMPSVNFLIARDFEAGVKYAKQCKDFAKENYDKLVYAPFSSASKTPPQAFYPSPMEHAIDRADLQINTCYSSTVDLAVAAKIDGWEMLSHASLPEQGEQMRKNGMLSNTGKPKMLEPSVRAFKAYATEAGVNPQPNPGDKKPAFDIQGDLLKKMRDSGISLQQYRNAMSLPRHLQRLLQSERSKL